MPRTYVLLETVELSDRNKIAKIAKKINKGIAITPKNLKINLTKSIDTSLTLDSAFLILS